MRTEIGNRLKKIRKERGLTQKELALKVSGKVDYTYIGKIERNRQFPSIGVLKRISDALSVPLSYFFLEEGTAVLLKLLPEDLKQIAKSEKKQVFLKALKEINEEDIPFFVEIIDILNKHRRIRRQDELNDKEERQPSMSGKEKEEYLKAADYREDYGEKDS
ncbi:MAG: helix-turn-helix domain-containing protein [Deltaproteobacteria bacterium]|nr:MAG: helix-turn-helix domain-containing protein [Deltaproteobacteria bacterium]